MLLLAALALLTACGGPAGKPAVPPQIKVGTRLAQSQWISRGLDAMPRSLDPLLLTDVPAQWVVDDLFEGLTSFDIDGNLIPGVARSWDTSPDGRTWTFHLRPEARWSNGDPVTAADFVYAWRREVDPKTGAEYAQSLAPLRNAMDIAIGKAPVNTLGVTAVDPYTLLVTLENPTPYLLAVLADSYFQPVPRATVERWGDAWTQPAHIVSNGPFVLTELVVGDRLTLKKNPRYWGAASVRPEGVTYYPLDTDTQVNRFMAGDLDYTSIFPTPQADWLRSQLGDQVRTSPYLGIEMLAFNMERPPFAHNRELRQALSMAVDREIISKKLSQGVSPPAYSLVPPLPGYTPQLPQWASWSDERRHAEARRLYAAAGYSAAHPLHVQLDYPTDTLNRDTYDAISAMWRVNLGAVVEPYNEEFRVLLQDLNLHKSVLFQNNWIGDFPDPFTFAQLFQTGFSQNFSGYSNARFDALLDTATREPDSGRRYRYFEQAEALLNQDTVYIPINFYATRHLIKPYLQGAHDTLQDRSLSRYMYLLEHEGR